MAVHAGTIHRDFETGKPTGIRFSVELAQGQVTVSILEMPPSIDLSQRDTFVETLRELATALMEAVQKPEHIHWHLQELPKSR